MSSHTATIIIVLRHDSWQTGQQQWDTLSAPGSQSLSCLEFRVSAYLSLMLCSVRTNPLSTDDSANQKYTRRRASERESPSRKDEIVSARQNQRSQLINHRQFLSFLQINSDFIVASHDGERERAPTILGAIQLFWMISINENRVCHSSMGEVGWGGGKAEEWGTRKKKQQFKLLYCLRYQSQTLCTHDCDIYAA